MSEPLRIGPRATDHVSSSSNHEPRTTPLPRRATYHWPRTTPLPLRLTAATVPTTLSAVRAVLAIAGCGPRLELALETEAMAAPALVALAGPTPRSDLVMAAVDLLLRAAGLTPEQLAMVVASRGPGSFTGIRVALATAQGLAQAGGVPAHAFPSLLAQAARVELPECLAVQPARRGFAFVQVFSRLAGSLRACGEPALVELASLATADVPVFAASGVPLPPGTRRADAARTTAEALLVLAAQTPRLELETLAPLYLEPPPASLPPETLRSWRRSP